MVLFCTWIAAGIAVEISVLTDEGHPGDLGLDCGTNRRRDFGFDRIGGPVEIWGWIAAELAVEIWIKTRAAVAVEILPWVAAVIVVEMFAWIATAIVVEILAWIVTDIAVDALTYDPCADRCGDFVRRDFGLDQGGDFGLDRNGDRRGYFRMDLGGDRRGIAVKTAVEIWTCIAVEIGMIGEAWTAAESAMDIWAWIAAEIVVII
ncbi:unnamed protein product [Prorocentrum cordatum]|uniref:Uncharacterized protein n=1 Tax=Prorocentrum cordatum TaxID=2364126 RepID=A0ABN9VZT1_9DINO|nr:unnamed protein product [Polarella glacialis]